MFSSLQKLSSLVKNTLDVATEEAVKTGLIEIRNIVIGLQDKIFLLQKENSHLIKVKNELEAKIVKKEKWEIIAKQYARTEVAPGFIAYRPKPDTDAAGTQHYLCQHCFGKDKASILNRTGRDGGGTRYACPECGTQFTDHADKDSGGAVVVGAPTQTSSIFRGY
ncbi:hypothetical protein [Desulfobacter hydrogenophilus]|nr:hypothetical protein [Desulfobacter hydrogenophilus]NDY74457.1 hypothetical protein [Desulfobacter hydrogenophilus]QBH14295.1 hypothetical protein EYB58_16055 [Desulfobacter hydrogenophilus]